MFAKGLLLVLSETFLIGLRISILNFLTCFNLLFLADTAADEVSGINSAPSQNNLKAQQEKRDPERNFSVIVFLRFPLIRFIRADNRWHHRDNDW